MPRTTWEAKLVKRSRHYSAGTEEMQRVSDWLIEWFTAHGLSEFEQADRWLRKNLPEGIEGPSGAVISAWFYLVALNVSEKWLPAIAWMRGEPEKKVLQWLEGTDPVSQAKHWSEAEAEAYVSAGLDRLRELRSAIIPPNSRSIDP